MYLRPGSVTERDALSVLKHLALEGGRLGPISITNSSIADRLGVSSQTVSRRLRQLETVGLIDRERVSDGQWIEITDAGERVLRAEYDEYRRLFGSTDEITLTGSVSTGMDDGRHFVSLPGYQRQFEERLGYEPFPGTFNVELDADSVRCFSSVDSFAPLPIDEWEDDERSYGSAVCHPVTVETSDGDQYRRAHVIVPDRSDHEADLLEILAPDNLRETLSLDDGDHVTVRMPVRSISPTTDRRRS